MTALAIRPGDAVPRPGNLRTQISGDTLVVPRDLASALQDEGIRTGADLLSYMQAFPSAIADILHWPMNEVQKATRVLQCQLIGHLPDEMIHPPQRLQPRFGAMDPGDLAPLPPAPLKAGRR